MHGTVGSFPRSSRYVHPVISSTGLNLVFHINYCSFIEWKACIFNYVSWDVGWLWNQVIGICPFEQCESTAVFFTLHFSLQHFKPWFLHRRKSGKDKKLHLVGKNFLLKKQDFHFVLCMRKYCFRFCFIKLPCS